MKYILYSDVMLRGYRYVPYAYYIRGCGTAAALTERQLNILNQCASGGAELEETDETATLVKMGLIKPYEPGDVVSGFQAYRFCDNRYVPNANWAITGRCNFNCRHCFNAADNAHSNSYFTREQAFSLIDRFEDCGVMNITLTGGEPMMHPDFLDVCREINRRGMFLNEITTNGSFITEEILDELSGFIKKPLFKVSFDGLGHHDWFRDRVGAEVEALKKFELLQKKGFLVLAQTNVHRGNVDTIIPTIQMFDDMNVGRIRIIRTTEAPRWAERCGDLCLSVEEYYEFALNLTKKVIKTAKQIQVEVWQTLEFNPQKKTYHHRPVECNANDYRDNIPVCRGNRGSVAITPCGDVVPCNQMSGWYKKNGIVLGNVNETSLQSLLQESRYMDAVCYTSGELLKENPDTCGKCEYWRVCHGGCRACAILFGKPGSSVESETDYGSENPYYKNYDPIKCLYFSKFKARFDEVMQKEGWSCSDIF